jgi:hypothetical protein
MCPANIATGGTDSIHRLVRELCRCGADAKILYVNCSQTEPMPEVYKKYECEYVTSIPSEYEGLVILPEIWANKSIEAQYQKYSIAVNWQGVDVYRWNNPQRDWYKFLHRKNILHFANLQYGIDFLKTLNISALKVSDCLDDVFFEDFKDDAVRKDTVLYNPVRVKMTSFQQTVMARATTELGVRFTPIENYNQQQLIDLFRHSKLYIDFGVFSGRERIPREVVTQGCCILTSNQGAAKYYEDNPIPQQYKLDNVDKALEQIKYILHNYDSCKSDFDFYRQSLIQDRLNYSAEVKQLYDTILSNYSCT